MGRIILPFRNRLEPGPLQLPSGPITIDWTHPLSRGLAFCVVPGIMGAADITGAETTTAATSLSDMTPEGAGAISPSGTTSIISGTPSSRLSYSSEFTILWRGLQVSNAPGANGGIYCGMGGGGNYSAIIFINGNGTGNWEMGWNNGGVFKNTNTNALPAGGFGNTMQTLCATFNIAGTNYLYRNGAQINSLLFGSAPSFTSPSFVVGNTSAANSTVTSIAAFWLRALSSTEVSQLYYDPYCFLSPAEAEMPVIYMPSSAAVFAQTNSPSGFIRRITTVIGYCLPFLIVIMSSNAV